MKKNTIREAVIEALKKNGSPLSAQAIYNFIVENDLYQFKAKNPDHIVKAEIRKYCEGVNVATGKPDKVFKMVDGKYSLKDK